MSTHLSNLIPLYCSVEFTTYDRLQDRWFFLCHLDNPEYFCTGDWIQAPLLPPQLESRLIGLIFFKMRVMAYSVASYWKCTKPSSDCLKVNIVLLILGHIEEPVVFDLVVGDSIRFSVQKFVFRKHVLNTVGPTYLPAY